MVVVAQERVFKTEGVSAELVSPNVGPWLSPKTSGWLNTACGYVVQTFKKRKELVKRVKVNGEVTEVRELLTDVEYCLRTGPDPVYITKFRQPKTQQVPTAIMDPDYHKIMSVVSGG